MILDELAAYAKERVQNAKSHKSLEQIKKEAYLMPKGEFCFEKKLQKSEMSFICEVKKASPSKGIISREFPYLEIAKAYEEGGADCISVLTEPKWFLGSDEIFSQIRKEVNLPMLRKDFTVDEYQIYEAKLMGADAVLLICALLETEKIKEYLKICDDMGISAVVETHDELEIDTAIQAKARIIGVNNRNLKNFTVDFENAKTLAEKIPKETIFVAESGVKTKQDILQIEQAGANAVLIGEALMRISNIEQQIKAFKKASQE